MRIQRWACPPAVGSRLTRGGDAAGSRSMTLSPTCPPRYFRPNEYILPLRGHRNAVMLCEQRRRQTGERRSSAANRLVPIPAIALSSCTTALPDVCDGVHACTLTP